MKSGAGDDLLDDLGNDQEDDDVDAEPEADENVRPDDLLAAGDEDENEQHTLPWIHRRDTVKSDRSEILQANVRSETAERERQLVEDVEERLGEDAYLLDVREAALLVAMDRPDAVADQLREWGYDLD